MKAMKLILPVVAMAVGAAGCSEDSDVSGLDATASVRFVNAISDAPGALLLTANGNAVGSALAFGSQASTCTTVDAGETVLALAGSVPATYTANLAGGGNYTVIAYGVAAEPHFLVLTNNSFDGNVAPTEVAVRFANLVPSGENTFNIFTGANMFGDPTYEDVTLGVWTAYTRTSAGTQTYIFTDAQNEEIFRTNGQLNLQGDATYTIAVLPRASGGFQLLPITGC
jgi:hypothetical protein